MMRNTAIFNISSSMLRTAVAAMIVVIGGADAAVVSRGGGATSTATRTPSRANNAATRVPAISAAQASAEAATTTDTEPAPVSDPEPDTSASDAESASDSAPVIENKSSQFGTSLTTTAKSARDASADALAEQVRRQRAALDAQSSSDAAAATSASMSAGNSSCDISLRECMQQKCGDDFTGCAGDGDTIWGDKMDACRRNIQCTAHQYQIFAREIKADRDMNAKLSAFNRIIDCGNSYNDCIVQQCGTNYDKCLGKTAGDAAIAACATLAKNCTQQDSGLAQRTMNVFGTLRQDAEKQIARDEERLYALRDTIRSQCQRMGALFDDRSLICVFTANFFAGNSENPTASKKLYAGSTFDCTPEWFGIDVTTFKENAYRYTRSITSATSAVMGAGVGQAVGMFTSGMIDRAVDRQNAEKAAKQAEKEYKENYGDNSGKTKAADTSTTTPAPETTSDGDKGPEATPAPETTSDGDKGPEANSKTAAQTFESNTNAAIEQGRTNVTNALATNASGQQQIAEEFNEQLNNNKSVDFPKQASLTMPTYENGSSKPQLNITNSGFMSK